MNRQRKSAFVLATVMTVILAVPGGAWADGGRNDNGWNKGGYKGNPHYNNSYGHYQGQSGKYPYNYYYPCNNCGNHNHNNHNHDNNLWIGLLGGGILGYALGAYQHSNAAEPAYYPSAGAATPAPTETRYETTYPGNTCLQQREYQTKIMVGGKQVQGYGTACLQPDGSWRYGSAQAETF